MAKYVVNKSGRVLHPTIVTGYLRERSGVWYCSYKNTLKSTGIRAGKETIARAMAFLENFVAGIDKPEARYEFISQILPEYLVLLKPRLSEPQFRRIRQYFEQYFTADVAMTDFAAIRALVTTRRAELAHGAETYRKRVLLFRRFFKWAIGAGYCTINPCDAILLPTIPPPRNAAPTTDELTAIYEFLQSGYWYSRYPNERAMQIAAIRYLSTSALRAMEMLNLTSADVLPDGLRIDGKRSLHTKPRIRYVPFALIPTLEEQTAALNKGGKLFPYNNPAVIQNALRLACRTLSLQHYSPHDLRRYAVRYWERELHLPPHIVNLLAGHSFAVRQSYHNAPNPSEIVAMLPKF